jgi:hypothetical protein
MLIGHLINQNQVNIYFLNIIYFSFFKGYVRSSQALEIVSLVFYVFAALFILIGLIDLQQLPFEIPFLVAAGLLFICSIFYIKIINYKKLNLFFLVIFISATLGLMSVQGRNNHKAAFLDWAWWNGLVGLIMTIICFFALLSMIAYMQFSVSSLAGRRISPQQKSFKTKIYSF